MGSHHLVLFLTTIVLLVVDCFNTAFANFSALGDPRMKRDELRVAFEGWNFCNEVGKEAPGMGSPRAADCFDFSSKHKKKGPVLKHRVSEADNKLGVGKPFHGLSRKGLNNVDLYAVEKELYLGSLCEDRGSRNPWQFWMVMLKNGNYDTNSGLCPENGKRVGPFKPGRFPCFGKGCMNQPTLYHLKTSLVGVNQLRGGFSGTYDLGADVRGGIDGISYYEVVWEKKIGVGSWVFSHKLKTSKKYPWLMLYLRADATKGFSGGYHYDTRGMMEINNGAPCDGDVLTDVTRYSEMIINPQTRVWCSPNSLISCPPFHITPNNKKIYRNNTASFPYGAYHYYCAPGNAKHLEQPVSICDPYSNPQAQELVQLLPHPIWARYGYPTKPGDGWVGDPRTWELDVGRLSSRLYFYQDPGTSPAKRIWTSIDMGTEVFVSDKDEMAEWTLSDFDVILTTSTSE
ncbi:hypothetical protein GIB67_024862 [Kingdonia uniflora]|uniref:DUF7705 domain-containing protein n=1 Tax=Kingdonia uniflora TaxID=39325 RepID=A0A7J7NYR7_9MAGN|nr:hypothetical protein GIB67_024862 [Kingdonia uniflora]